MRNVCFFICCMFGYFDYRFIWVLKNGRVLVCVSYLVLSIIEWLGDWVFVLDYYERYLGII